MRTTTLTRLTRVDGVMCRVDLTREGSGYAYTVWQYTAAGRPAFVCLGWTQGGVRDGLEEAEDHARLTMTRWVPKGA
jgi:hypothetical protein